MMRWLIPLMAATSAQAGTFTPPEGCRVFLTVQSRACIVAHYWTCPGNAPGAQWSGEITQEGLVYVGQIDRETQWLKSYFLLSAEEETLIQPAADPASLTELLASGIDTYDFTLNTTNGIQRVVGYDKIIQRDLEIDGEVLHLTEYDIRTTDEAGEVLYAAQGSDYVSAAHRRFFAGHGTITEPFAPEDYDDTPVDFIYPGEPGFLSDQPLYGCAAVTARHDLNQEDPQP